MSHNTSSFFIASFKLFSATKSGSDDDCHIIIKSTNLQELSKACLILEQAPYTPHFQYQSLCVHSTSLSSILEEETLCRITPLLNSALRQKKGGAVHHILAFPVVFCFFNVAIPKGWILSLIN